MVRGNDADWDATELMDKEEDESIERIARFAQAAVVAGITLACLFFFSLMIQ